MSELKAQELFKSYTPFKEKDPFNDNIVEGFLSNEPTWKYGALYITHVNGELNEQFIAGVPKINYPFDRNGVFKFSPANYIEMFTKLDGTSVLMYEYKLGDKKFISYKVRQRPFIQNSKFGDFLDMWLEILDRYKQIPSLIKGYEYNVAFELYGSRNKHTILYEAPLDTAVLFGVTNNGKILSPTKLDLHGLKPAFLVKTISSNFVETYKDQQETLDKKLKKVEEDLIGDEGQVWYLHSESTLMIKLKPHQIEDIHWKGGLSKLTIKNTCQNVFESNDELNWVTLYPLLREEWSEIDILVNEKLIIKCIDEVNIEVTFKQEVIDKYKKFGKDINIYKNEVMKHLSQYFDKKLMKKVYNLIVNE